MFQGDVVRIWHVGSPSEGLVLLKFLRIVLLSTCGIVVAALAVVGDVWITCGCRTAALERERR